MIPKIKRLAKALYQALRHPCRTGSEIRDGLTRRFTASFTATVDYLVGRTVWLDIQDNQGAYHLPKIARPIFFVGILLATPTAAVIFSIWLTKQIQSGKEFSKIVEDGAIIPPGLLAGTIFAALLFSVTLHIFFGGLAMLGILLRKLEAATRPERDKTIQQQNETIEDQHQTIEGQNDTIEVLRNQIRRSGQEPEA